MRAAGIFLAVVLFGIGFTGQGHATTAQEWTERCKDMKLLLAADMNMEKLNLDEIEQVRLVSCLMFSRGVFDTATALQSEGSSIDVASCFDEISGYWKALVALQEFLEARLPERPDMAEVSAARMIVGHLGNSCPSRNNEDPAADD